MTATLNVVFDLGAVVVTWEPDAIIASVFADAATQDAVRSKILRHPDWLALDRGTLPLRDAVARGASRTGLSRADVARFFQQIPPALVPIPGTLALLQRLKARGHRLFCLSNMHMASIEHLEQAHGFWEVFEGVVISCRVNLIKPEPAIYAHLLEKYRLRGEETVFVDDMEVNLAAAAKFGIRTIRFAHPVQCERELHALGIV